MTNRELDDALNRYSRALRELEEAIPNVRQRSTDEVVLQILERSVLKVLLVRNEIDLEIKGLPAPSEEHLVTLTLCDKRLKQQSQVIARCNSLKDWQTSFKPPPDAWWWFPESSKHQWDRRDWLWSFLTLIILAAAFSLIANVAPRFLSGNPSIQGAFAVISQSFIALLTAGSLLTNAGQKAIERALEQSNIPTHFRAEVKFSLAILLLLGLVGFHSALPWFATAANGAGLVDQLAGRFTSAQAKYEYAIRMSPDYFEAHYNLGSLYEDLQNFDDAQKEYQIAVQGKQRNDDSSKLTFLKASNNLARLLILKKDYIRAVPLLGKALNFPGVGEDFSEPKNFCADTSPNKFTNCTKKVKYDLLKNLGWARLGQERFAEAEPILGAATLLDKEQAPAHCLLAQVYKAQGDKEGAFKKWRNCRDAIKPDSEGSMSPDEDNWLGIAQQEIEKGGKK
ncbi:tetratricopeptide repeat protein [Phormidesmis priestleyi]